MNKIILLIPFVLLCGCATMTTQTKSDAEISCDKLKYLHKEGQITSEQYRELLLAGIAEYITLDNLADIAILCNEGKITEEQYQELKRIAIEKDIARAGASTTYVTVPVKAATKPPTTEQVPQVYSSKRYRIKIDESGRGYAEEESSTVIQMPPNPGW